MTFDEILEQVLTLLKRQGRVSYSALKRRFDLNDDYLNDLKDEILYVHPVRDDEGRGLIWTGDTASGQGVASPPALPTPQPAAQEQPSSQVEPRSPAPPPDAERRQLTVMFCDLVDSTRLSSQLDPEDWRDVVRAYQRVCTEVIQRYDGHIAQYLGDGLLIYFGFPVAHEDDAQRAVRTGLDILAAMEDLNKELKRDKGITLAVRLGIHTGLVVVGAMGGGARQEQLALGETPNVAARIQGLAASNTLAISEATYRLVQGYFECQDLGAQTLRGVSEPLHVYRVLSESGLYSRLDVAQTRGLTPLVGREQEVGLLLERWAQAKSGQGQVVLLTGDAGIGKSRLVQMLKDHVANEPHMRWECRSLSYYQNTALYPLTDLFQRTLQWQHDESPDEKLGKLEHTLSQYRLPLEETVPLFAPLLSLPDPANRYPLLNLSPQRQRQKTLEAIIAILLEQAEQHPVLFIIEDLHWTDPTTLELIGLLLDQTPTAALLVLLTCRSHFQPAWHHRSYLTEITVNRLSHAQVEQIVTGMTDGKSLPQEVLAQIFEKTDGVPLFVEEITKAILESGQLTAVNEHYELTESFSLFAIPATLQDSLMARLDRLVTAKGIAQLAAVIGRQFPYDLLQAVSQLDEAMLQPELGKLVEAEIVYQRGAPPHASYIFKHALIRDAAYESLLKSTRQGSHQRIAHLLEAQFPETVAAQPELLAHHYTEAGLTEKAVHYWYHAGQRAVERSAHAEAIGHLMKGLELLPALPETPERLRQELTFQGTLGLAFLATKGLGSVEAEHTYTRARQLSQRVNDTPNLLRVLFGLRRLYFARADLQRAYELGMQLRTLTQHVNDPTLRLGANQAMVSTLSCLGEWTAAHACVEESLALAPPQQTRAHVLLYGVNPCVTTLAWGGIILWALGYPEQARRTSDEAVTLAQALSHAYSLAMALVHSVILYQLLREDHIVQERTDRQLALSHEQGFPYWASIGMIQRASVHAEQGQRVDGLYQGLTTYHATGAVIWRPYFLVLVAEACKATNRGEEGLRVLDEALTEVDKTGERWFDPELYRLKGDLLLQLSPSYHTEVETCFLHAISIAQSQQAKSWELRAATSLAKLWQQQGKRQEAHDLLAPVYEWFTEGLDTADLKDAKALLDELT
jgi:class 3 adenylate cyclase/predicted ATPase